jgi:RecA-family ATPase
MSKKVDVNDKAQSGTLPPTVAALTDPAKAREHGIEIVDVSQTVESQEQERRPLDDMWRTLADAGVSITATPSARAWLLKKGDAGVLPLGKAGVIAAAGGTGKTMLLTQLALAVAAGKPWLGVFQPDHVGPVLLALAEEDMPEIHRRMHNAAKTMDLAGDLAKKAEQNIVALPLAGYPVALTARDERGNIAQTAILRELRDKLNASTQDWKLVILDPLARWAAEGSETDNAAATRFVQACEVLTSVRGNPTVLVAHHSSAASARSGESNVRGVTAIVDGFRWAAVLDAVPSGEGRPYRGARLRHRKSNYSMPWPDVYLVHDDRNGGAFLPAPAEQASAMKQALEGSEDKIAETNAEARMISAKAKMMREERLGGAKSRRQ